jgi:hypothetical protein
MADETLAVLPLTPFLTGEPVILGASVSTPADLLRSIGLPPIDAPGVLAAARRIALIHSIMDAAATAIHIVRLPHVYPDGGQVRR